MNKALFLILAFIFTTSLYSQNRYGALAGINYSNVKFPYEFESDPIVNFYTGAVAIFPINSKLKIETNLTYSRKGYKQSSPINEKIILHYLDIQLLSKFKILNRFNVITGAGLAFLASITKSPRDPTFDPASDSNIDFHLDIGVEYNISEYVNTHLKFSHTMFYAEKNVNLQFGFLILIEGKK